jgi:hypothetical protein
MKESKNILLMGLCAIFVGGAGFYGGTLYQKGLNPRGGFNGQLFGRGAAGGMTNTGGSQRAGGMGLRPVSGEIISKDDKSITVKMQDGSSRIVMYSTTTQINKAQTVDATSLVVGETVRVFGSVNTDGSVTAQDIQLNPAQQGQNQPGK